MTFIRLDERGLGRSHWRWFHLQLPNLTAHRLRLPNKCYAELIRIILPCESFTADSAAWRLRLRKYRLRIDI